MLDRVLPPDRLPELLAESDFVVLAAPLTDDTRGLIGEAAIGQLKPGAWVINVARGELVDERALVRALRDGPDRRRRAGHVPRGAAAARRRRCTTCPNVILTPHTSWSSTRVLDRSVGLFCDNLRRYAAGEPLVNVVDPTAGY